ncbi:MULTISPECIES: S-layer homology domain-containing protein [Paenibacillus]|uniref:SLH domain-containing protein n=1 Tax=Paenibacillus campinasensis TaxID=66347 RepID=A0A268ETL9_9BACL|nr:MULTISPECIES: S-layer homology domain-containing protein [Paenibacillus]PAD76460.1 hypothetical protein CHH67_12635 [Paenibacillus campinasensis]PAK55001.1 hypothetical protein CHH75_05615 [Paenibacillus sp. 7541]
MVKKNVALILILLFVLSPASVFAADAFSLALSAGEVKRGEKLTISGTVPVESGTVVIKVVTPRQTVLYIDVVEAANSRYEASVQIPADEDLAPSGIYTVAAGMGTASQTKTFIVPGAPVVNPPGGGGGENPAPAPGSPGSSGGGSSPTPQPDGSGSLTGSIPAGVGSASGSVIRPELTSDGRYIVGAGTITEAADQAQDSVTIQLPAEAGQSGAPVEFPSESLRTLQQRSLELIVTTGDRTVRFPAGSIPVQEDLQARVRIVLKSAYTEEARALVQRSIGSNSDYASTDIVLSVVIEIISGNSMTEIHQLNRPAVVSLELTEAQERSIASNLAGVYYVNGRSLEYVPGTLKDGRFTFTAGHFSYYAILEYNKTFTDLAGHWAEEAVKALAAKHLVTGVDERRYEPNRSITRAEFATLLMRALNHEGIRADAAASPAQAFRDVPAGRYYSEHVKQAATIGLMSGYGGAFRPNDPITREEAVVALVRAAEQSGLTASKQGEPAFADAKSISAWAAEAVNEAWSLGLIQGDGTRFNPKHSVNRAEVAIMIHRLITDRSL